VKLANGETWTARLGRDTEDMHVSEGDRMVVTRIDGATAEVAPEERSTTE
jgi:membrane protein implicated in regulation of membrane protease activity